MKPTEIILPKPDKKTQEFLNMVNALTEFRNILFSVGERAANDFMQVFKEKNNL